MNRELVSRYELWLHNGATLALWAAVVIRVGWGYAMTRNLWLLDSQIVAVCLLLAALYVTGSLVPRSYSAAVSTLLGTVAWLAALSLLPRYAWPTTHLANWLLIYTAALLLLALLLRAVLRRRWYGELRGHGYAWMEEWAQPRALYARMLALRVMRSLGYRQE
jgi:hypothetical protein